MSSILADTPEKIWATYDDRRIVCLSESVFNWTAYVRADISDARIAELVAENERLKQKLVDHPRDTNTVVSHKTANMEDKPEKYPSASAAEVDPDGAFEQAYAEAAGVCPTTTQK